MPRKKTDVRPDMNAMTVFDWAKRARRTSFTTVDVATQFGIAPTRAAAFMAILRIKELVKPLGNSTYSLA